jgi:hypothetical protein
MGHCLGPLEPPQWKTENALQRLDREAVDRQLRQLNHELCQLAIQCCIHIIYPQVLQKDFRYKTVWLWQVIAASNAYRGRSGIAFHSMRQCLQVLLPHSGAGWHNFNNTWFDFEYLIYMFVILMFVKVIAYILSDNYQVVHSLWRVNLHIFTQWSLAISIILSHITCNMLSLYCLVVVVGWMSGHMLRSAGSGCGWSNI